MLARTTKFALASLILSQSTQVIALDACPAESDPTNKICAVQSNSDVANHPRRICDDTAGSLRNGASSAMLSCIDTQDNCRDRCLLNSACKAYSWNSDDSTCNLYSKKLKAMGFKKDSTKKDLFNHHKCWTFSTDPQVCQFPGSDACENAASFSLPSNPNTEWNMYYSNDYQLPSGRSGPNAPQPFRMELPDAISVCHAAKACAAYAESQWVDGPVRNTFFIIARGNSYSCEEWGTVVPSYASTTDPVDIFGYNNFD